MELTFEEICQYYQIIFAAYCHEGMITTHSTEKGGYIKLWRKNDSTGKWRNGVDYPSNCDREKEWYFSFIEESVMIIHRAKHVRV